MLDAACLEDHLRTCKLLGPPPFRHGHFGRGLTLRQEIGHENSAWLLNNDYSEWDDLPSGHFGFLHFRLRFFCGSCLRYLKSGRKSGEHAVDIENFCYVLFFNQICPAGRIF